jgi:hypothetical protein
VQVYGDAQVSGDVQVYGDARVYGSVQVYGIVRSDRYVFVYVPCSDGKRRVIAGCRYFTMEEAREHWRKTRGGTSLGDETFAILDCLEKLAEIEDRQDKQQAA